MDIDFNFNVKCIMRNKTTHVEIFKTGKRNDT